VSFKQKPGIPLAERQRTEVKLSKRCNKYRVVNTEVNGGLAPRVLSLGLRRKFGG